MEKSIIDQDSEFSNEFLLFLFFNNFTIFVLKEHYFYSVLHQDAPALEIGDLSYALREGLIEMELVVLRYLRFRLNFEHPHQVLSFMYQRLV